MNTNNGTAMYIPPDFFHFNLCHKPYGDWWAFGITIYQIIENQYPFLVKEKMCDIPINLSNEDFRGFTRDIDNNLKDLIKKLLEVDINKRLGVGNNGTKDILKHAFFKNTNAKKLYRKEK
ncbi:Protein kinase [Spraguea lophii 42_110]|uniref:cAMP-dependent protein kinase n=1 Tax=Spraguea lophii (strain 42_110) TaxID=1358809 RepID=S7W9N8_SPRLO|nr:Protein kinase [Spraguea lophii 42_110]